MPGSATAVLNPYSPPSDSQLASRVRNFALSRTAPSSTQLRVDATGGTVTLSGAATSFYQKQVWISAAQRVSGVLRVIDEIEVKTTIKK